MRDTDTPRTTRPELPTLQTMTPHRLQWLAAPLAELHDRWTESWDDGFLHRRWEDIRQAPRTGWHGAANWLKATDAVISLCLVLMVIDTAADIVLAVADRLATAAPKPETSNRLTRPRPARCDPRSPRRATATLLDQLEQRIGNCYWDG